MYPQSPFQKYSRVMWLAFVIVVLIIVGIEFMSKDSYMHQYFSGRSGATQVAGSSLSGYQAIFLTNGQVYFGKISKEDDHYIVLDQVFYLKVVDPLQGTAQGNSTGGAQGQPQISLIKLGNELHGPADEMHINRQQVLFYEDLKMDSNVIKNINEYNKANNKPVIQ